MKKRGFAVIGTLIILGTASLILSLRPQAQFTVQAAIQSPVDDERLGVLGKPSAPGAALQFEVVSDVHVQPQDMLSQERFRLVLSDLVHGLSNRTDALIVNGDPGDGKPEDYDTLGRHLAEAKKRAEYPPVLFNIGNHEFYKAFHDPQTQAWSPESFPNGETDEKALARYLAFMGEKQVYYETVIKGYHFPFLGSEKSRMSDHNLGDEALE